MAHSCLIEIRSIKIFKDVLLAITEPELSIFVGESGCPLMISK